MVRFKNRYLLCHIDTEHPPDPHLSRLHTRDLLAAIRASLLTNFGDLAVARAATSLAIKLWSPALALCLVRCARHHFRTVWAAVSLITALHPVNHLGCVRFSVLHVGGTIRSCQRSAAQRATAMIRDETEGGGDAHNLHAAAASVRNQFDAMDV